MLFYYLFKIHISLSQNQISCSLTFFSRISILLLVKDPSFIITRPILMPIFFSFNINFYTHFFSVWSNLPFVQCAQFFSLTFTIHSLHLRSTVFQIPIMTISAFSILALTSTIHSLHCSLFIWEIYHSLNFHHLICIFHFYHLFYT